MCSSLARVARVQYSGVAGWLLAAAVLLPITAVQADYPGTVVRIEEDWEFVAAEETNLVGVTCATAPLHGHHGEYMTFELNHQSQPGYAAGGLHLNVWNGETLLGSVHAQSGVTQNQAGETIRWTQSVSLNDGQLVFEVRQGSSVSWGAFGNGELRAAVDTNLNSLNQYDVDDSLSGLVLATDGVQSLTLKTVRLTTSNGTVYHINLNRNVLVTHSEP